MASDPPVSQDAPRVPALPRISGVPGGFDSLAPRGRRVEVGQVLDGKYKLLRPLDDGGMGSLFVAHNLALDVNVAVKVIRADLREADEDDTLLVERLLQEARAAARLGHAAIVRTFDVGTAHNGDPYLVMELLEGEDLASTLVERGRLSPTKALRVLLPIAHALAAAHECGIVHRDLKPDNILLTREPDGRVQPKLIDFGVAKLQEANARRLTAAGHAIGTPGYMSPEQARGEDVDARADIWAFTVVLFETLTGRLPFEGDDCSTLLRSILDDEPAKLGSLGVSDERLACVVCRGLAKDRTKRWRTMRELGRALADWLIDQGVTEDIAGGSLRLMWQQQPTIPGRATDALASIPPPAELLPPEVVGAAADKAARAPTEYEGRRIVTLEGPALEPSPDDGTSRAARLIPLGAEMEPSLPPPALVAPEPNGGPKPAAPPLPQAGRPAPHPYLLGSAVVLALVLLVGLGWMWRSAPAHGVAGGQAASSSVAAPVATFVLRIESIPAGASVTEHGRPVGVTPLEVRVRGDEPTVPELVVSAPGYEPFTVRPGRLRADLTVRAPLTASRAVAPSATASSAKPWPTTTLQPPTGGLPAGAPSASR